MIHNGEPCFLLDLDRCDGILQDLGSAILQRIHLQKKNILHGGMRRCHQAKMIPFWRYVEGNMISFAHTAHNWWQRAKAKICIIALGENLGMAQGWEELGGDGFKHWTKFQPHWKHELVNQVLTIGSSRRRRSTKVKCLKFSLFWIGHSFAETSL